MKPIDFALGEFGTLEDISSGSNPRVLEYFAKVGHSWVHDDATAWCAAFIGWCLESAGITSTKALNARSYLKWGTPTTTPKIGDIAVLWRESPNSPSGHVGFFIRQNQAYIWLLSGNQSDRVCIEQFPVSRVLSYRTFPQSTTAKDVIIKRVSELGQLVQQL